jgi:hypothetical protein
MTFTVYETMMDHYKNKDKEYFEANEEYYNIISSFAAGAIASSATNGLEVVTVIKQTDKKAKIG